MKKLFYRYSINRGKSKEGTLDFDTSKYWDERNNHFNVISDYLQDQYGDAKIDILEVKEIESDGTP